MKGQKRGASELLSTVVILGIVFALAALIGPWAYNSARTLTGQKANQSLTTVQCQGATYDFDTSWNGTGTGFNLTASPNTITAKILNTGYQKLWNFTFVVTVNQTSILGVSEYTANATTQRLATSPLRPGESALLGAVVPVAVPGTITRIRIVNAACPQVYIERAV